MGIMALVWVNMSSSTTNSATPPSGNHKPMDSSSATVAPKRNSFTRSPVRSLSMPQP